MGSGLAERAKSRQPGEAERQHSDDRERELDPGELGETAERRSEDGAEDRRAERGADHLAPSSARRGDRDPGEGARPRRRAGDPLDEPRAAEREGVVRRGEREARHCEEEQARDNGALRPEPGGGEPARDASEERSGAIGADEQPRTGLRQVELVGVHRDERRQCREEQRVHEDDRADQEEETAHSREDRGRG